jgi:hypothetical protein
MNSAEDPTASMRQNDQKIVVIYYGNDTYASRNDDPMHLSLNALRGALEEGAEEDTARGNAEEAKRLQQISYMLETETERFKDTVSEDIAAISKKLCQVVPPSYQKSIAGFVYVRNFMNDDTLNPSDRLADQAIRRLRFTACRPDNTTTTEGYTFEVPRINDFPYVSQPLSHPLIFQKFLEAVRGLFPGDKHRYILITKSHGSEEIAIGPNLSLDLTEVLANDENRKEILDAIRANKKIDGLDKMGNDPILASMDETVRAAKRPVTQIGTTKGDYIQILRDLGIGDSKKQIMNFPIVLMESCRSDLRLSKNDDIQWILTTMGSAGSTDPDAAPNYTAFNMPNVGWVFTSDKRGLGYREVRYSELASSRFSLPFSDFQDAFKSFLDAMAKKQ